MHARIPTIHTGSNLRNQVCASLRPAHAWFKNQYKYTYYISSTCKSFTTIVNNCLNCKVPYTQKEHSKFNFSKWIKRSIHKRTSNLYICQSHMYNKYTYVHDQITCDISVHIYALTPNIFWKISSLEYSSWLNSFWQLWQLQCIMSMKGTMIQLNHTKYMVKQLLI